jgi:hypothetical protein
MLDDYLQLCPRSSFFFDDKEAGENVYHVYVMLSASTKISRKLFVRYAQARKEE